MPTIHHDAPPCIPIQTGAQRHMLAGRRMLQWYRWKERKKDAYHARCLLPRGFQCCAARHCCRLLITSMVCRDWENVSMAKRFMCIYSRCRLELRTPPPACFREQTTQQHPLARVQAGSPACIFTYAWVGHEVQVRVFRSQRDCVCDVVNAVSEHNCRLVGGSGGQVGRVLDGSDRCCDGAVVGIITSGVADVHSRCFNVPGTNGTRHTSPSIFDLLLSAHIDAQSSSISRER